ncbi:MULTISPECIES: RGCVC family protein [unclassified Nocardia]|uniref:RGCVC family protein n=1 Tax=unclassified Nocardia TaxID=2637762 RepID=UPI002E12315C|nr:RGCVC family protein [Nocardia sp. NBC_01327]
MSSNEQVTPIDVAPLEFSCAACPHDLEAHAGVGVRFCSATATSGLDRGCVCVLPAEHEKTYYRR